MNSDYFNDIVEEINIYKFFQTLNEHTLFIYSPTSLKKINFTNKIVKIEDWHNISKDIEKINRYLNLLDNKIEEIVTFGGGSTIDIGKYIAYKLKKKYICIPSMLSTNSYATNKVALLKENKKITIQAKMPNKIIIDNEILKLSKQENLYGLIDVLSIYTALYDWKIANIDINEKIDNKIYRKAESLLKEVLNYIKENSLNEILSNNMRLLKYIGTAGYITNLYGTGRPESGSEHILAKEIESRLNIPHGITVSVGILLMSLLQNRNVENILEAIEKMEIFTNCKKYRLTKQLIEESFFELKPRRDRYTIINRYKDNKKYKIEILKTFFDIVNGEF